MYGMEELKRVIRDMNKDLQASEEATKGEGMDKKEVRYHIEFDVEGDISLMMHHLLTLGKQHWNIIGGEDGVKIENVEDEQPKTRKKNQIDRLKEQSNKAIRDGRISEAVRFYNQAWEIERGIKRKG